MAAPTIDRPIFLLGCGRSGTTLLYEVLCGHRDLAWFSNYTERWPARPELARLSRVYPWAQRRGLRKRGVPAPSEGYPIFDRGSARTPSEDNRPLSRDDVGQGEREYLRSVVTGHLRHQGARRFINKNTRNARRQPFLDGIFDDALYVHLVRDPRATVNSLMRVAFWPQLRLWWEGDRTTAALTADGHHPEVLAAKLWRHEVSKIQEDTAALASDRVMQLQYENLIAEPRTEVTRILKFVDLPWRDDFEAVFASFDFRDNNQGYRRHLTAAQIERIDDVTGDVASRFGYRRAT